MSSKRSLPHPSGTWSPTEEFLDQTIEVWQPSSQRKLTREDAREIAANVLGFFQVLMEWEHEDKTQRSSLKQDLSSTSTPGKRKLRPSA